MPISRCQVILLTVPVYILVYDSSNYILPKVCTDKNAIEEVLKAVVVLCRTSTRLRAQIWPSNIPRKPTTE